MYNLWLEYIILINQEESTAMINVVQMRRRSQGLRCVLEWKHNNHFRYVANRLLSSGIILNSQASITQSLLKLFLYGTISITQWYSDAYLKPLRFCRFKFWNPYSLLLKYNLCCKMPDVHLNKWPVNLLTWKWNS